MAAPGQSRSLRLASLLSLGGCLCCARPTRGSRQLCESCEIKLASTGPLPAVPPAGVDRIVVAAAHAGVARELVSALKFRRRLGVAEVMAERLAPLIEEMLTGEALPSERPALVPVPSAPWRRRRRGFNPAAELARSLAAQLGGGGVVSCLRRRGESHQVGQTRGRRLAPSFEIEVRGPVPPNCLLIDDVYTTGGTLTACAIALRRAGAQRVAAATFTHTP